MKVVISVIVGFLLGALLLTLYHEWLKIESLAASLTFDLHQVDLLDARDYEAVLTRIEQKSRADFDNFEILCKFFNCLDNSHMKLHYELLISTFQEKL